MTHDELTAKIIMNWFGLSTQEMGHDNIWRMQKALRAVVELHTPVGRGYQIELQQGKYVEGICSHCGWAYPCHTIQTIEKELK